MPSFKQLRKRAEKSINSKYTPDSVKEALVKEILGKCKACEVDGKKEQAIHDRFGLPLCKVHNDYMQEKLDEKNAKKDNDKKNERAKEDMQ